jgi:hypothetical protein
VLREILAKPRILQRTADMGLEAQWSAPEEFAERIRADVKLWAAITRKPHRTAVGPAAPETLLDRPALSSYTATGVSNY